MTTPDINSTAARLPQDLRDLPIPGLPVWASPWRGPEHTIDIANLNRLVAEFDAATDYRYDYVSSRDMLIVLTSLPECRRGLADELDRALRAVAREGGAL